MNRDFDEEDPAWLQACLAAVDGVEAANLAHFATASNVRTTHDVATAVTSGTPKGALDRHHGAFHVASVAPGKNQGAMRVRMSSCFTNSGDPSIEKFNSTGTTHPPIRAGSPKVPLCWREGKPPNIQGVGAPVSVQIGKRHEYGIVGYCHA